jgi:repressor LexA
MTSMALTARQQEILDFIEEETREKGVSPSTREIQAHFGFASQNAVLDHLEALKKKGAIQSDGRKARSITLSTARNRSPIVDIPLFGTIPAGLPTDQEQENERCISIDIESLKIPKTARTFALSVRGDSMINAGIHQGDTIILEFKDPRPKDIVAALIDGETTLKRYLVRGGKPYLKAENPKYPDLIPAQELVIQGVAIFVLRSLK